VTVEDWFEQQAFLLLGSPLTEQAGKHTYNEINTRNNAFATMIRYGSNGESIHIKQVTAVIGQQSSNGKRAEPSYGGRTLPFYQKSEIDPISKGYAFHSYLEGYTFIEAFFISQCGREGITSTAINTASAGYLARRMTKMNERIIVGYDYMAKAANEIIQLIYPFDAWYMETQKIEHVKLPQKTIEKIYKWDSKSIEKLSKSTRELIENEYATILRDRKQMHKASKYTTINDGFAFPVNIRRIVLGMISLEKTNNRKKYTLDDKSIEQIIQKINDLCDSLPVFFTNPNVKVIPKRFVEVSEMTCVLIRSILSTKRIIEEYAISHSSLNFAINEIKRHFAMAIIAPKEMIGYVSAQSISEIATQVTIDAFHNVGISSSGKKERVQTFSRLLEILNYKKETNYPLMVIPLSKKYKYSKDEAVILKNKIEHLSLRIFLQKTEIIYDPDPMNPIVYDKKLVDSYFKYTPNERERVPGNVSPYMVRMTLNRQKVFHKQIDMLTFKLKLEQFTNLCYVIISDINDDELIIRVHFNMSNLKDFSADYELRHVEKILDFIIHDLYVRGIKGLANINIVENLLERENDKGEIEQAKEYHLETEGTNLYGVAGLLEDRIDKCRLETNEISMIYKKYGIEAARNAMIKEAIDILRATKPKMSYMHMRLLIDNMTYGGSIMPLNRHGFKRRNPGALIRMAFEQNTMQITKAALYAELDELKNSPTGGVMFGQLLPCGTGSMVDVYMDESKVGISDAMLDELF
jgi:DNA-directed RNA polymerase II subunit RPB1